MDVSVEGRSELVLDKSISYSLLLRHHPPTPPSDATLNRSRWCQFKFVLLLSFSFSFSVYPSFITCVPSALAIGLRYVLIPIEILWMYANYQWDSGIVCKLDRRRWNSDHYRQTVFILNKWLLTKCISAHN